MTPETAKQLELSSRRPLKDGVIHVDECVSIVVCGVPWYVRPLYPPDGIKFTPAMDGEDLSFGIDVGTGNIEVQKAAEALITDLPEHLEGYTLVVDAAESGGYLSRICKYLIALIDQQYELANEQKMDLLSFRGVTAPVWLEQSIRHAQSMQPETEEPDGPESP